MRSTLQAVDPQHRSIRVPHIRHMLRRLRRSLEASIGDIAFGMEDGAVSIAGLVFGVAASTGDSRVVVLAGATGAAAGAVSMMAGTYLDVESERDRVDALIGRTRARIAAEPAQQATRIARRLRRMGFTESEVTTTVGAIARDPAVMLDFSAAFELGVGRRPGPSARVHAAWMFVADLAAASVPVIPFVFLPIGPAMVVSMLVTAALLAGLGVARGRIGHKRIAWTAGQTLLIAGAAAAAGVLIGRLVIG